MIKFHSFWPWLHMLLFPLLGLFAAGDSALASLGADSGIGVMDGGESGEADGASEDTGGEGGGAARAEGEPTEGEAEPGKQDGAAEGKKGPQLAKPLSRDAAGALKGLKESNPKGWKELNSRLWALDAQDKKIGEAFPEGLDSAIQLKGNVDQFLSDNGAENLGEIHQELQDYRRTDRLIEEGDPAFIKELPEAAQVKIYEMLPSFVTDWATRDEAGYQKFFSGLVYNTLRDTDYLMHFRDAMRGVERMGLDNEDVKEVHDLMKLCSGWMDKLKETSTKAIERKQAGANENDEVAREREKLRNDGLSLARQRVGMQFRSFADPKIKSILSNLTGGKVPDGVNTGEVIVRAITNLSNTLGPQFAKKIDGYLSAGDEAGAIRFAKQQATDDRLTKSLETAYEYLYGKIKKATTAAGGGNGNGKERNGAGAGNGAGANGAGKPSDFRQINYNPSAASIDIKKTTELAKTLGLSYTKLITSNRAVLKNGHKVAWKQDAPDEQR